MVSHRPAELPRAVRWMTRTADQDAMGLALPSTAEADGYTAEKAKGNVKSLVFQEEWRCSLSFGALDKAQTAALQSQIEAIRKARTCLDASASLPHTSPNPRRFHDDQPEKGQGQTTQGFQ